jgi:hypothetical protein
MPHAADAMTLKAMSDTYEINERNQVVPYTAGRKCTDTRAWRDATDLELQQQEQISQLERDLADMTKRRDELLASLEKVVKYLTISLPSSDE